MSTPKVKRAILATGGMDSTVLIYRSVREDGIMPRIITVNYGQAAFAKQVECLCYHMDTLNIPRRNLHVIDIGYYNAKPGLFNGKKPEDPQSDDPNGDLLFTEQKMRYDSTFIEGRNLIMVSYAMAYCSANKIDELQVGYLRGPAEWENQRAYKMFTGDNSPQFVDLMNMMAFMGFSHQVRIRAPYYEERASKRDVAMQGASLGVNFDMTNSCYWPEPCGECDNCILRKDALAFVLHDGEEPV